MSKNLKQVVDYIIRFLLQDNSDLAEKIGYTSDIEDFNKYSIIIIPSGFFDDENYGEPSSIPPLPLKEIENVPLLFGSDKIDFLNGKIIVYADIIASSFFLLSRYEEFVRTDCFDRFGRFEGKKSLQYAAGFLNRPIVDEYGTLLRSWLQKTGIEVQEPKNKIAKIYLTHDIDILGCYQSLRSVCGGIFRSFFKKEIKFLDVVKSFFNIERDPAYTFNWLIEQDNKLKNAEKFYFAKAMLKTEKIDKPTYNLNGKKFANLLKLLRQNSCKIGLHSSYKSLKNNHLIDKEKEYLEKAVGQKVTLHRSHFLAVLSPNKPEYYVNSGISDDFTLGFADITGFRLGTCKPVLWINPQTLDIVPITLHPLTVMDCTLNDSKYMNLDYQNAFDNVIFLLNQIKKHNGEAVLLWHNTAIAANSNSYHRELYKNILNFLK